LDKQTIGRGNMSIGKNIQYFIAVILPMLFVMSGCKTGNGNVIFNNNPNENPVKIENTRPGARVLLLTDCPCVKVPEKYRHPDARIAPVLAPVIASLIPVAADFTVATLTSYLKKVDKDKSANYVATGAGILFKNDKLQPRCLIITRGKFGPIEAPENLPYNVGSLDIADLKMLGLANYPDFYFEAWLLGESKDGSGLILSIKPQVLHFARQAAKNRGSGSKHIAILLTFVGNPPAEPEQEAIVKAAASTIPLKFEKVVIGNEYKAKDGHENENRNPLWDQNKVFKLPTDKKQGGYNIYAFIAETEDASELLTLFISALEGKKDDISTALQKAIKQAIKDATGEEIE
jgi:hypothetical protein